MHLEDGTKVEIDETKFCFFQRFCLQVTCNHSLLFAMLQVVKELQVTMFQALVLLLFNEKLEWTFEEIANATKIGGQFVTCRSRAFEASFQFYLCVAN